MPKTIPSGTYDLVVTNLDDHTATLSTAFTVEGGFIYLPIIIK